MLNSDGVFWSLYLAAGAITRLEYRGVPFLNNDHAPGADSNTRFVSGYDWHPYRLSRNNGARSQAATEDADRPLSYFLHELSADGGQNEAHLFHQFTVGVAVDRRTWPLRRLGVAKRLSRRVHAPSRQADRAVRGIQRHYRFQGERHCAARFVEFPDAIGPWFPSYTRLLSRAISKFNTDSPSPLCNAPIFSLRASASRLVEPASPMAKNISRQEESVAALTHRFRDSKLKFSPFGNRRTASIFLLEDQRPRSFFRSDTPSANTLAQYRVQENPYSEGALR